jgi:Tol biopolymer transport system component
VVATFNGILTLDRQGRASGRLVTLPAQSFPAGATLDPAGQSIVFALISGTVTGSASSSGFGSDLYQVAVDGSGLQRLVTHEQENVFYSGPAFDPSGRFLYFQRRASVLHDGAPVNDDGIERLDLATGERKRMLTDGTDPTISPDGRTLVYVHLVNGQVDTMWIADADGANPRPFFKVKDRFFYMQTPRFAPSGCQIVFSGAGRTLVNLTAGSHSAHLGIPSELYLSPCDGSSITTIGETFDDVTPVWSPDGTRIGFAIGGQVSQLTIATREITKLAQSDAFTFGDLVWLK